MDEWKIDNQVKNEAQTAVREYHTWPVWIGRSGFAGMAAVHLLVGILAVMSVVGAAAAIGTQGSIQQIAELPFGQFLLVAVAVGLVCHSFWLVTRAVMDTDAKGSDSRGIASRGASVIAALIYLGLAFSAVRIVLGVTINTGSWAQTWTAWLLAKPFGQWLVGLAGAIAAAIGTYYFYQAYSAHFQENLLLSEMSTKQKKWVTRFGRFGFAARGLVLCIIGFFLAFAGWHSDAGETRDFGGALYALERRPYGTWLLAFVAAGLISYGIFLLLLTRFRRMVNT